MKKPQNNKKIKKPRKKLRLVILLSLWLLVAVLIFVLLLDKPAGYRPEDIQNDKSVSQYVTNELAPYVYNNIQLGQSFDIIIPQSQTKEFISLIEWPIESEDMSISAPQAFFVDNGLVMRANAETKGLNFVITTMISGLVEQTGMMSLNIDKIMIGSVNVTYVAKIIAKAMYQHRAKQQDYSQDTIGADIAASLFDNKPFDPVFEVRKRKVRVKQINIEASQLKITLAPAIDQETVF